MMIEILFILAVWRVTFMLVNDTGPGYIFTKLREALEGTPLERFVSCVSCVSIWVAAVFALGSEHFLLSLLAYSGGALIINILLEK